MQLKLTPKLRQYLDFRGTSSHQSNHDAAWSPRIHSRFDADDDEDDDRSIQSLKLLVETILTNDSGKSFDDTMMESTLMSNNISSPPSQWSEAVSVNCKKDKILRLFERRTKHVKHDIVPRPMGESSIKAMVKKDSTKNNNEECEITCDVDEESLESLEFLVDNML